MSRIKDYLAEVEDIDDLKRPFYMELGERAYVRAKNWAGVRSWFRENAEYGVGEGDMGRTEYYFENFEQLCEEAVTEMVDKIIEENALDISDETYTKAIEYGRDWLADTLADFESECIQDHLLDIKYPITDEDKYGKETN